MYKIKNVLSSIKQYHYSNDFLFYLDANKNVIINDKPFELDSDLFQFLDENYILFFNHDMSVQNVVDIKNNYSTFEINNRVAIYDIKIKTGLYFAQLYSNDFSKSRIILFDILKKIVTLETSISDVNVEFGFEDKLIYNNSNLLYCTNYITNTPLWQLPLSELGSDPYDANASDDIKEILGVVGNNLWFYSRCGRLLAVDVESGSFEIIYESFNFFFDTKSQNIYSISSNIFCVIDTTKLEVVERYFYREEDPTGIGKFSSIYSPLLQGDYFTFLAEKDEDYGGTRRVGIFDYKARKLVWEHEVFTQEEVNQTRVKLLHPRPLKMSEDTKKLYILDSADSLHIFEREENV